MLSAVREVWRGSSASACPKPLNEAVRACQGLACCDMVLIRGLRCQAQNGALAATLQVIRQDLAAALIPVRPQKTFDVWLSAEDYARSVSARQRTVDNSVAWPVASIPPARSADFCYVTITYIRTNPYET